jgi:hypothetical protein
MTFFNWLKRRRLSSVLSIDNSLLSDRQWLALQLSAPKLGQKSEPAHTHLPFLPTKEEQLRFTGRSGKGNLLQAFEFYKFVRTQLLIGGDIQRGSNILDFGCGWGRVARFWLRDIEPSNLWCADCLDDAIDLLKRTQIKSNILQNAPTPPIENLTCKFRLIYAFSVFSHLSESAANAWIEYFAEMLHPGGTLVITTRGRDYIGMLARLRHAKLSDHHRKRLLQLAPPQAEIETKYASGEFVFFPTGGGGQLTDDFYGEAMISPAYAERFTRYGFDLSGFHENVPLVDQSVVVLTRK